MIPSTFLQQLSDRETRRLRKWLHVHDLETQIAGWSSRPLSVPISRGLVSQSLKGEEVPLYVYRYLFFSDMLARANLRKDNHDHFHSIHPDAHRATRWIKRHVAYKCPTCGHIYQRKTRRMGGLYFGWRHCHHCRGVPR